MGRPALLMISLALWAVGFIALGYQAIAWLQSGEWPLLPLKYFAGPHYLLEQWSWKGAQKAAEWLLDLNITAIAFVIAAAFFLAGVQED